MAQPTTLLQGWRKTFFSMLEAILFGLMVALLGLVVLQVFTRYVLEAAVPWTEEVARMLLVWTVMLGAAVATERKTHYVILIFSNKFRGLTQLIVLLGTNLLGLIFLAVLVDTGITYAFANMHTVYISTQWSRGLIYLALPIGAAIMALSLLTHSIEAWINRNDVANANK